MKCSNDLRILAQLLTHHCTLRFLDPVTYSFYFPLSDAGISSSGATADTLGMPRPDSSRIAMSFDCGDGGGMSAALNGKKASVPAGWPGLIGLVPEN